MPAPSIGQKLKFLRDARGKNQRQVAIDLQISQQSYSAYENDAIDIPTSKLRLLADYYHVSLDWLVTEPRKEEILSA